jgi:hypothetical protein
MEEANLSERGKALYEKLHVSRDDIEIARSCARYIKRKGWHTCSFLRRGTVPYARPFASGRGNIDLPKRLTADYGSDQKILHERLLQLRHTEYAHLDASRYRVTPYKGDLIKSIENIRDVRFTEKEIDLFLLMTDGLLARITERMEQLRLGS